MFARYMLCIFGFCVAASTAVAQQNIQTSLKTIMQGLRNDTVLMMDAMLIDDFDAVVEAAKRIADHPRIPPEQVSLVAAELGPEMAAFKQFDTLVHDLSLTVRDAAEVGDGVRVQKNFQDMIAGCLGCHSAYRQRVSALLAGEN